MKFVDEVKIYVAGGNGGEGMVAWRREKYVPQGGPDGGDGGNGGCVVFVTDPGLNTLIDFSFNPEIVAADGENGGTKSCFGRAGEDVLRPVPVGTQVFFKGQLVADLSQPGARWIAARGGHGGKGNAFFKTPTNRAPDFAQKGQPGEKFELELVLKSVADVGLVGLPNVGKSTLISVISKAHPKIADYPFTTIRPNLGVVMVKDKRVVVADIPGLIPGAHEGKGLGIKFLKHIERTHVLGHLIDVSQIQNGDETLDRLTDEELEAKVLEQFTQIDFELSAFSENLIKLPRIIIFSKGDLAICERGFRLTEGEFKSRGFKSLLISSVTGLGLEELKQNLAQTVAENRV